MVVQISPSSANLVLLVRPFTVADLDVVVAAQKKTKRRARKAAKDALVDKAKRRIALQHQKTVLCANGSVYC